VVRRERERDEVEYSEYTAERANYEKLRPVGRRDRKKGGDRKDLESGTEK